MHDVNAGHFPRFVEDLVQTLLVLVYCSVTRPDKRLP